MQQRRIILSVLTLARTAMGFQFQSVAAISPFLIDRFQRSYAALAGHTREPTGQSAAPLWFASAMMVVSTLVLLRFRRIQTTVN